MGRRVGATPPQWELGRLDRAAGCLRISESSVPAHKKRGVAYQIPRNSLALLMVAQVAVVLPFVQQLSPWLIAVGLFCGAWRFGVYQGRWDYPRAGSRWRSCCCR